MRAFFFFSDFHNSAAVSQSIFQRRVFSSGFILSNFSCHFLFFCFLVFFAFILGATFYLNKGSRTDEFHTYFLFFRTWKRWGCEDNSERYWYLYRTAGENTMVISHVIECSWLVRTCLRQICLGVNLSYNRIKKTYFREICHVPGQICPPHIKTNQEHSVT